MLAIEVLGNSDAARASGPRRRRGARSWPRSRSATWSLASSRCAPRRRARD